MFRPLGIREKRFGDPVGASKGERERKTETGREDAREERERKRIDTCTREWNLGAVTGTKAPPKAMVRRLNNADEK